MADEDRGNDKPSLELPSLRFGRKKERPAEEAPTPAPAEDTQPDDTRPLAARTEPEPAPVETMWTEPVPVAAADEAPTVVTPPPVTSEPVLTPAPTATAPAAAAQPEQSPRPPRVRRERSLPALGGMAAAMITGVLVGVFTVGLVWASVHLCEVVRGTSSCGGPGYLLLLAIMVAMVLLGAVLLRAWGLPDPTATSFLAVGLMGVLALLMVGLLFNWWMIIVIPVVTAATFALAHWVTASFTEPAER